VWHGAILDSEETEHDEEREISELFRTIARLNDETEKLPPVLGAREKIQVPLRFPLVFRYYI
jgi:hypothetical protein